MRRTLLTPGVLLRDVKLCTHVRSKYWVPRLIDPTLEPIRKLSSSSERQSQTVSSSFEFCADDAVLPTKVLGETYSQIPLNLLRDCIQRRIRVGVATLN